MSAPSDSLNAQISCPGELPVLPQLAINKIVFRRIAVHCMALAIAVSLYGQTKKQPATHAVASHASGTKSLPFGKDGAAIFQADRVTQFPFSAGTSVLGLPNGGVLVAGVAQANAADIHSWQPILGRHWAIFVARLERNGTLDPSFGDAGIAVVSFAGDAGIPRRILVQPDGKILILGCTYGGWVLTMPTFYGHSNIVARLTSDGHLDSSYGKAGIATVSLGDWMRPAEPPTPKPTTQNRGYQRSTQSSRQKEGPGTIYAGSVQPDGKLVLGGERSISGDVRFRIVRLNGDGTPDPDFKVDGLPKDFGAETITGLAVQPNGNIWAVGQKGTGTIFAAGTVARLLPDGTPDDSFGYHGYVLWKNAVQGVFVDGFLTPNGKFLIAGGGGAPGGFVVARFNLDGTLDKNYGKEGAARLITKGFGVNSPMSAVATESGEVYISGTNADMFKNDSRAVRFSATGLADSSWSGGALATVPFRCEGVSGRIFGSMPVFGEQSIGFSGGRLFFSSATSKTFEEGNSSHNEIQVIVASPTR